MVRVDAFRADTSSAPGLVDWNANNVQNLGTAAQDLNFDGNATAS
jgi:hypothetical protein